MCSPVYAIQKAEENNRTPIRIKNKITTFGVVDIWRNMTVQDLAGTLSKDLGNTLQALRLVLPLFSHTHTISLSQNTFRR